MVSTPRLAYFFATLVAFGACGDDPPPRPAPQAGRSTSCGNAVVDQQLGEICDPNDPATRVQQGTNMPCNAQTCNYQPPAGAPQQNASQCPTPIVDIGCNQRHEYNTQSGQARIDYYNTTCAGNTAGPELAYSFKAAPIPGQPLQAIPVRVTLNDGPDNEDLDIYVIAPGSTEPACSPQNCISWGPRSAEFLALPGIDYTLIVDGRQPRGYVLEVKCQFDQARSCQSTRVGPVCN